VNFSGGPPWATEHAWVPLPVAGDARIYLVAKVPAGFPEHWHCFILQFLIINGGLGRTRTSEHQYLERAAAARALVREEGLAAELAADISARAPAAKSSRSQVQSGVVYICTIRMSVRDL
jgi:hypothetical protein